MEPDVKIKLIITTVGLILIFTVVPKIFFSEKTPDHGIVKEYFDNGKVAKIKNYEHHKLNGVTAEFYDSGGIWNEWTYKDDVLNGPAKTFHKNGIIMVYKTYVNGVEEGLVK